MKVAIMQPYFFPYLGYFDLINQVDTFVFLNDVNYINKGWVNRNRILVNNLEFLITLPIEQASQNKLIKDLKIHKPENSLKKFNKTINMAYKKHPYFNSVKSLVLHEQESEIPSLDSYLMNNIMNICNYLDINTNFIDSSNLLINKELTGEKRIIEICKTLSASDYVNLSGGKHLYNENHFLNANINLVFTKAFKSNLPEKFSSPSIIEMLMSFSKQQLIDSINQRYHYDR